MNTKYKVNDLIFLESAQKIRGSLIDGYNLVPNQLVLNTDNTGTMYSNFRIIELKDNKARIQKLDAVNGKLKDNPNYIYWIFVDDIPDIE